MRVVFMGTPDFAVPTLDALVAAGHEVVLVVAQPSKPAGRGMELRKPPVAERAEALGLPLIQPKAVRTGKLEADLRATGADVAVVVAYGRILPPGVLQAPRLGCVNVHASLLPRWRGAAPIQAAILHGDTETGVCTQRMEEGLDTGPVYLAARTPIAPDETASSLHDRLAALGAAVAVATLDGLEQRVPTPQDDALATWAPLISKADGALDWTHDAAALDRRVRAMSPWPGAHTVAGDKPLRVITARPVPGEGSPGVVLRVDPLTVAAGAGALELITVQAAGKRPVSGADFARGARLKPGDPLGAA